MSLIFWTCKWNIWRVARNTLDFWKATLLQVAVSLFREAVTPTRVVMVVSRPERGTSEGTWCSCPPQWLLDCRSLWSPEIRLPLLFFLTAKAGSGRFLSARRDYLNLTDDLFWQDKNGKPHILKASGLPLTLHLFARPRVMLPLHPHISLNSGPSQLPFLCILSLDRSSTWLFS